MFIAPPPPPPVIPQPIIIWVHGTRASSIFSFLEEYERAHNGVNTTFTIPTGLKHVKELRAEGKTTAVLKAISESNPDLFPLDNFYSFGWSGQLSVSARKLAAQHLYQSIKEVVDQAIKKHGNAPPIYLISHSHGGNIILYMADHAHENAFTIQKTILLACPVQKETSHLVHSPFFGTIYSIHSHVDMVQIMEPQRLQPYKTAYVAFQETRSLDHLKKAYILGLNQPLFSERHFAHSNHIIEANVGWRSATPSVDDSKTTNKVELFFHGLASRVVTKQRGVLHTEFVTPTFMRNLGQIITNLDNHRTLHGMVSNDIEILI